MRLDGLSLLQEGALRREVAARLGACWQSWGYREVLLPAWLPWEEVGFGATGLPEQACKLLDPQGRVLSLRPDNTLMAARLASRDLAGEPRPLRLHYCAEVFRRQRTGEVATVLQAGVELIGSASPLADAEVLALAAEGLRALGIGAFRLAVGHVGVLRGFLRAAGLEEAARRQVMEALQDRDYVRLERALAGAGLEPGRREEVLARLTGSVPAAEWEGAGRAAPGGSDAAARNLGEVLALLEEQGLSGQAVVELGLVRDLDYYTGLVFEVAAPGAPRPLGGGGRYDGLLGRFGREEPATGFAFEVAEVMRALGGPGGREPAGAKADAPRVLVTALGDGPRAGAAAWARARAVREAGGVAELDVSGGTVEAAVTYARRRGMDAVLVVSAGGEEEIRL